MHRASRARRYTAPAPAAGAAASGPGALIPSSRLLLGAVAAAAAIALALIAASLLSSRSQQMHGLPWIAGGLQTARLLDGIPQHGNALGSRDAPVTLVEYADLQCPYCAQWARDALPVVVGEYVRTGRLRIVFRGLAFLGPESETALRAALAAARQGKLWNVVDLIYRNQGSENGGGVTDEFLHTLGNQVPRLDPEQMLAERALPSVTMQIEAAKRLAAVAGVTGTPTFELGPTGGALGRLEVADLDAETFREALETRL